MEGLKLFIFLLTLCTDFQISVQAISTAIVPPCFPVSHVAALNLQSTRLLAKLSREKSNDPVSRQLGKRQM